MHPQIRKHLPKEAVPEEFEQSWQNASYILEPLYKAIKEQAQQPKIRKEDFELPAFKDKLVFDQARFDLVQQILSMFPTKLVDR